MHHPNIANFNDNCFYCTTPFSWKEEKILTADAFS